MSSDIEELEALAASLEKDPTKAGVAALVRRAVASARQEELAEYKANLEALSMAAEA